MEKKYQIKQINVLIVGYRIKSNKKNMVLYIAIPIFIIIIIVVIIKSIGNIKISIFGKDYTVSGLLFSKSEEKNNKTYKSPYTNEQQKEKVYDFIEKRGDYAVMNINGKDLANDLNTGSKMVDFSKVCNYQYGRNSEMTVNAYIVSYQKGTNFIKIIADSKDDKIMVIRFVCKDTAMKYEIDLGMTEIFSKIEHFSNTKEDFSFWTFNNYTDKWQDGNKTLYENGLGIKYNGFYEYFIVACPNRQFYTEYTTNL